MVSVVLLLAGNGSRMHAGKNKMLIELKGKPLFMYSIDLFMKYDVEIICVVNKNELDYMKKILPAKVKIVVGGDTRGASVYNGLKASGGQYVLIHDGARPFVSTGVINEIVTKMDVNKCILTYMDVKDTIREKCDNGFNMLDRSNLIAATTPQCGGRNILLAAYEKSIKEKKEFTDDIQVVEAYYPNVKIDLVKSNDENFKVTTPIDLMLAKMIVGEK